MQLTLLLTNPIAMKKLLIIIVAFMVCNCMQSFACCTYLNSVSFLPRINDSVRLKLNTSFTKGPPVPPFAGFDTDVKMDTLKIRLYYDLTGIFGAFSSWREDTINIGVLPDSIHAIHILPYSFDNDTIVDGEDTTFEGRDTTLLKALSIGTTLLQKTNAVVFPNPVSDILYLPGYKNIGGIIIRNTEGKLIRKLKNSTKEIDVSELPAGLYILQLEVEGQWYSHKFLKE